MKRPTAPPEEQGESRLDPVLPNETQDESFRLQEISRLKKYLEKERDKRAKLYKKYRRGTNVLDGIDAALVTASMGLGVSGVGLLSTIIAAPIVLGLEIAALSCGALGLAGKFVSRKLSVKAKKHDEIRVLASSKLNTITDHVSQVLTDGRVTDVEFRLILEEVTKYDELKKEIRAMAKKAYGKISPPVLDEETKNSLIQRGREEAKDNLIKKLTSE